VAQPEKLFWQQVKKNLKGFSFIRLESRVNLGVPDVLACSDSGVYLTLELKVTSSNKVNLSPHQISYHVQRETAPAFILVKRTFQKHPRKYEIYLYAPNQVRALAKNGLVVPARLSFGSPVDWSKVQGQLDALLPRAGV
jgi:Holliday junction resolvase